MIPKSITCTDGGTLSYHQVGSGPGVILVHGGFETWRSHEDLAVALSDSFTVYLPDRRGRGSSSPHGVEEGITQTEVNDMAALARETGARFIFGVSSGAIICLQACLEKPSLFLKAVIFEPPLLLANPSQFDAQYARFERAVARNDTAAMLVTGMKITDMGPPFLRLVPFWIQRLVVNWFLSRNDPEEKEKEERQDDAQGTAADDSDSSPSLRRLAPTFLHDLSIVKETRNLPLERFAALKDTDTEVLLLCGTATNSFLIRSCDALEKVIPEVRYTKLPGLNHMGSGNKQFGGSPELVANVMKGFLKGS